MKTVFEIPYPSTKAGRSQWSREYGLNAYWSGKHWAKRKEDARYWHSLVRHELQRQGISCRVFLRPVFVRFWWYDGLDIDNHAAMGKMIVDALKGVLLADDSKKYFVKVSHEFWDKPSIRVEIEEVASVHD